MLQFQPLCSLHDGLKVRISLHSLLNEWINKGSLASVKHGEPILRFPPLSSLQCAAFSNAHLDCPVKRVIRCWNNQVFILVPQGYPSSHRWLSITEWRGTTGPCSLLKNVFHFPSARCWHAGFYHRLRDGLLCIHHTYAVTNGLKPTRWLNFLKHLDVWEQRYACTRRRVWTMEYGGTEPYAILPSASHDLVSTASKNWACRNRCLVLGHHQVNNSSKYSTMSLPSFGTTQQDECTEEDMDQREGFWRRIFNDNKGAILILLAEVTGSSMDAIVRYLQQGRVHGIHPFQVRPIILPICV